MENSFELQVQKFPPPLSSLYIPKNPIKNGCYIKQCFFSDEPDSSHQFEISLLL